MATIASEIPLVVDFSRCQHLDSTILGTLHEIVSSARRSGVEVALQAVSDAHRGLFEELAISPVLEAICDDHSEPPPGELRAPAAVESSDLRHRHILRAHEVLASLSESNHDAFRDVIEDLSKELGAKQARHRA
jgi:MFS superfamily sulfate permease-like transporter